MNPPPGPDLPRGARPRFAALATLSALAALAAGCGADAPPPPRHIVLISLDTFRADHLGCYGNPVVRTPAIDALAAQGVLFEDVTAAAPTTLASHVALFTGTWPNRSGVVRNGFVVHPDNELLPESLAAGGYRTAGFAGSFALTSLVNFAQGFDHWDEEFEEHIRPGDPEPNQRRAAAVTDAVLDWLDATGSDAPTFLFAHYFDAHHPYEPPPPYDTLYEPVDPALSGDVGDQRRAVAAHHEAILGIDHGLDNVIGLGLRPELVLEADGEPRGIDRALAARYAGEVTYLDAELGRLFDGLKSRGIWDDALVIVTADHGETFWEHGDFWNHGLGLYQTTVRLPLIVKLPSAGKASAGGGVPRKIATPVSQIDICPTVLELCGLDTPRAVQGASLVDALAGGAFAGSTSFSEATQPTRSVEQQGLRWLGLCKAKAVRQGRYKLIWTPYLGIEELYDIVADPEERVNLMLGGDDDAIAEAGRLRARLEAWSSSADPLPSTFFTGIHGGTLGGPGGGPGEGAEGGVRSISQQDYLEILKEFGYLGEAEPDDDARCEL